MSKFTEFVSEKNALGFKELFQEAVAEKVSVALEEAKKLAAKGMFVNPAEIPASKTPLHSEPGKGGRGDISMHTGQVDHGGGFSNPIIRKEAIDDEGLNADEINKGPGIGGGFTNKTPVSHISNMPKPVAGAAKLHSKETSKGK
jgi:hypothetical protein